MTEQKSLQIGKETLGPILNSQILWGGGQVEYEFYLLGCQAPQRWLIKIKEASAAL